MLERWPYAYRLGVGFGLYQTGISVAGVAADAAAEVRRLFIEQDRGGGVERTMTAALQAIDQLLDARLVTYGGKGVRRARWWLGGVLATFAVNVIDAFGLGVVRLQFLVSDWPCGREAGVMAQLTEVLLAQPKQRGSEDLGRAADEIVRTGLKGFALGVVPCVFGDVAVFRVNLDGVPVSFFARQEVAAFEQQDVFAGRRQVIRERTAAGPGPDDDHVVVSAHRLRPPSGRGSHNERCSGRLGDD